MKMQEPFFRLVLFAVVSNTIPPTQFWRPQSFSVLRQASLTFETAKATASLSGDFPCVNIF